MNLRGFRELFGEMNDLKRVRVAHAPGSVSEAAFSRSWSFLLSGEDPENVALLETARAVAAARLGGMDAAVLKRGGLTDSEVGAVLHRAFDAVSEPITENLRVRLSEFLSDGNEENSVDSLPGFVGALARQPRAGCTRPGRARLMLEPPESHAEHCQTVAVYAVLLSEEFGADAGDVFIAGLAHHLHNAAMPDSGFTGEMMVGEHLERMMQSFLEQALSELPASLRAEVERVLLLIGDAENPVGRAFNAADVMDRVLQMQHYARGASFTLDQALEEMNLVHEGPVKDFHEAVLNSSALNVPGSPDA